MFQYLILLYKSSFFSSFQYGLWNDHIFIISTIFISSYLIIIILLLSICGCSKFSRITPLLRDLHWLPVRQRISFKILLIVYKALLGQTPTYISELLKFKSNEHTHNLRSSLDILLLQIPSYKTKITLGDRAFACAAPKLWNNLPLEIRKSPSVNVFKSKLKAHLFI